ncbi:MAG TPA: hypothetical protein VHH12_14255, partial [Mycobacterium sp.]|nr:hypothetical protein [Mycobacterium sp.]
DGEECLGIEDSDTRIYFPTRDDVGSTLRVAHTISNRKGSVSGVSDPTDPVRPRQRPIEEGPPAVEGEAKVGDTMFASSASWNADSGQLDSRIQWQRCNADGEECHDIPGADDWGYAPVPDDLDHTLRIRERVSNRLGAALAVSPASAVVGDDGPPRSTASPHVDGPSYVGERLTASVGEWSNAATAVYDYQWRRCDADGENCTDLPGATDAAYTPGEDDLDARLRVAVSATNNGGTTTATSEPTQPIGGRRPPANVALPEVDGLIYNGETAVAQEGTWIGAEPIAMEYQWLRCSGDECDDIDGATEAGHEIGAADIGSALRVRVTATNSQGTSSATSPSSAVVEEPPAPTNVIAPAAEGEPAAGEWLTATTGEWQPRVSRYEYQWRRCDSTGDNCTDINGATASTYQLRGPDADHRVRLRVRALNVGGAGEAESEPTESISPPNPPESLWGSWISGNTQDRSTLTLEEGGWAGTEPIEYTRQWQRCNAQGEECADIPGADGAEYKLLSADVRSRMRVRITATNDAAAVESVSELTSEVTGLAPQNKARPTVTGNAQQGATLTAALGEWDGTDPMDFEYQWRR